jgi:hypothetical protein
MDPAGAAALQARLEQQRHWQLAAAVREGRQPRADPDVQDLRSCDGDERSYCSDADGPFVKRLVDGVWARGAVHAEIPSGVDQATPGE